MPTKTFGRRGLVPATTASVAAPRLASPAFQTRPAPVAEEMDGGDLFIAHMPLLTFAIIAILLLIYAGEQKLAFDIAKGQLSTMSLTAFGASSFDLVVGRHEVWRLFLTPLLHGSLSHVLGNSFALFFVGLRLEPLIGRAWFAAIFAASAAGGVIGSLVGNPHMVVTVGASGAITGLIGALFVISFDHRAREHNERAMRATALKFGIPALAPLLFGATGHTDYCAHLGGVIAGACVAWTVCAFWDEDSFRPSARGVAGVITAIAVAGAAVACLFAAQGYSTFRAKAALLIPESDRPRTLIAGDKQSYELLSRYPQDPLAHVIRAIYLADHKAPYEAELQLRQGIALAGTDPQNRPAREVARSLLAVLLAKEGRVEEARRLVGDLCQAADKRWGFLHQASACGETTETAHMTR